METNILQTVSPKSAAKLATLSAQADAAAAQARAESDAALSACVTIENLLAKSDRLRNEIASLQIITSTHEQREANARKACECWIGMIAGDGYQTQNWVSLTDQMHRIAAAAPAVPAMIAEREVEIEAAQSEIKKLCAGHGVILDSLRAALRDQRIANGQSVPPYLR
jgi:hypothetical protein